MMKHSLTLAGALVVLFTSVAAPAAFAADETNASSGLTLKGSGLAVHGYDVVAYFTEGEPTLGRAEHSAVHGDATYRFASNTNLEAFQKDPDKYLPRFGGYCAFGVSVGAKLDGDPRVWKIVDDRLYLQLNPDILKTWQEDIPGNVQKAERNWKKISGKTPEELK